MSKEAYLMRFVPSPLWMLVFLLALPAALCAQKARDPWSNLSGPKAGQGIEVIESGMKQSAEPSSPSSAAPSEHCPAISKTPDTVSKGGPVTPGRLIKKVGPKYPASARKAHIEGTVVLCATISEDGNVQNLRALFGPPELIPAAMDAAKQWRYMPYRLNDKPVEVDSEIHIDFKLSGR